MNPPSEKIILFIGQMPKDAAESIRRHAQLKKEKLKTAVIKDLKEDSRSTEEPEIVITCDFGKSLSIAKALLPYQNRIIAVTCRGESRIHNFAKVIPNLPYLRTPSSESLIWATDKITMRERFRAFDKSITPKFLVVHSTNKKTLKSIEEKIGFPFIIKPAGLASSLLVSICYHKEDLEKNLKKILRKINNLYKKENRKLEPKILIEEFMEGDMYSIDAYVSTRGKIYLCPMVHVKTGRAIGFDDFFGYQRLAPTKLSKTSIEEAEHVASLAVHALCLRSTTAHIELMKTEQGWKVIELGPRIGGFRHQMYKLSYGIDHSLNDVLIRLGKKPTISKKPKGFTAAIQFFAKEEGALSNLQGIHKTQTLKSYYELKTNKKIGDRCLYAKHGGKSVCDLILFNKKRSDLLADIRRAEQLIIIKTSKR